MTQIHVTTPHTIVLARTGQTRRNERVARDAAVAGLAAALVAEAVVGGDAAVGALGGAGVEGARVGHGLLAVFAREADRAHARVGAARVHAQSVVLAGAERGALVDVALAVGAREADWTAADVLGEVESGEC